LVVEPTRETRASEERSMHCKFNPKKKKNLKDIQVGFIALNKNGEIRIFVFRWFYGT
jgi:hypothetical protein